MAPFEITWRAPEFEYRRKNGSWYLFSILAALVILGLAVWQRNFLLAVFIVIAEILFLFWGNKEPETVDFVLNEKGVAVGPTKFYPANDLQSFGIGEVGDEWAIIALTFKRALRPATQIIAPRNRIEEIQKALKEMADQVEVKETLTDAFERFFKF